MIILNLIINVVGDIIKFLMNLASDVLWGVIPVILIVMCAVITLAFFPEIWGRLTLGFSAFILVCVWYRK
ncbi:hypothetical protein B6N31_07830 [Dickeya fangzhongdai]|nr:hypothetical protein B6N31_07830 [Dickeya fangzhongdai]